MKCLITLVILVGCVIAQSEIFDQWQQEHGLNFDGEEYAYRLGVFKQTLGLIKAHNDGGHSWTMGLNKFSAMTDDEFSQSGSVWQAPQYCSATKGNHIFVGDHGNSTDWRKECKVTKVKDQGSCGSCWAFSTVGALESHWGIRRGGMHTLSEQQLVDCAGDFDNHGCRGGLPSQAFEYIFSAGGLTNEDTYPYHARDEKCYYKQDMMIATDIGSVNITEGAEEEVVDAIWNMGPVSIAYQVAADFRHYKRGVYDGKCKSGPMDVNHAVLAVGYELSPLEFGMPYYIVKNSWGGNWGLQGYFYMRLGVNKCGVATCASYPKIPKGI